MLLLLLRLIANDSQSVMELSLVLREAASIQENRHSVVITMSDQIPVWLKPQADKVLQPIAVQQQAASAKKRRATRLQLADGVQQSDTKEIQQAPLVRAVGNPASSRWRVSFVARQCVHHWFSDLKPEGHPNKILV